MEIINNNIMKKAVIIINKQAGESNIEIAKLIKKVHGDTALIFDGRNFKQKDKHFFGLCKPNTKTIIIADLDSIKSFEVFYSLITEKITINKQSREPFQIEIDRLIIIMAPEFQINDLPKGASFTKRFSVVEFPNENFSLK